MSDELNQDVWRKQTKVGGISVYVFERANRGNALYLKVSSPHKHGRDRRVARRLPGELSVRDSRGVVRAKLERIALMAAETYARELFLDGGISSVSNKKEKLTLKAGFDRLLCLESGKYPDQTLRYDEVKRASRKLMRLLPPNAHWEDLQRGDIRGVWRRLAREYLECDGASSRCGARQTEVTIDAFYSCANWLRGENMISVTACLPPSKRRSDLKADWTHIVQEVVKPSRLRHSEEEYRRLFAALRNPDVDPRFALVIDLGSEQRLGQFLRARRSQLILPTLNVDNEDVQDCGELQISGTGKKIAHPILLTAGQRTAVDAALTGYLSAYEELFESGAIKDYFLFPQGRLCKGKAIPVSNPLPLGRTGALKMFKTLEKVAGVASLPGRGWYGVKRACVDMAAKIESDPTVLNNISGHEHSATRLLYRDTDNRAIREQAARVRARIRQSVAST